MSDFSTAIIVQARMSSARLPGKSLQLIGDKPLIYYVIQRLKLVKIPLIVCTSDDKSDDKLYEYLGKLDVAVYRGSLTDVLKRYIMTAKFYNVKNIIRVTGDNPLVDIEALKGALILFKEFTYVDAIYPNGWIKGSGFELVKLKELESINSKKSDHKEHVTLALREYIDRNLKYKSLAMPTYQNGYKEIVLTCDYPEDLQTLQYIFKYFDYRVNVSIEDIIKLYETDPVPFKRNYNLHK